MDGICNPQSMGLGGGFLCTYYDYSTKKIECLNAREYAPIRATPDMFDEQVPLNGGLSVCVPGEIMGYWDLHQKYGKLDWCQVLKPAVNYCKNGIPVTRYGGSFLELMKNKIMLSPTLKEMFTKGDRLLLGTGDLMLRPNLGNTLEQIACRGPKVLYDGELTENFVKDVQNEGGVLTIEDMKTYKTAWVDPVMSELPNDLLMHSPPQPGSGAVVQLILNVIFGTRDENDDPSVKWPRIVETWKHAFGFRCLLEGPKKHTVQKCINHMDAVCIENIRNKIMQMEKTHTDREFYSNECFSSYIGGGTCNVCVLAPNGDAVCVTSSINSAYGAMFASRSTGIILNNHMMDFNVARDPTSKNDVEPEKQPLSSMSPSIILDKNTGLIRLIIGSAGGPKIITAISQIILDTILYKKSLQTAMDSHRLHHQLMPMKLYYEEGFPYIDILKATGHDVEQLKSFRVRDLFIPSSSSATAIEYLNGVVGPYGDKRRDGFGGVTKIMR
ncbi:scoloptoxin SSD14 isoform X2 [Aethina tumida]|nr:scoloptoxin SSD14 isoform X2 [Aethina tumida]